MTTHTTATTEPIIGSEWVRTVDVLIVGAGISGISAACHVAKMCPLKSFAVLEGREQLGGTWDLFRYPGIRSDSDMQTLGFRFRPWTGVKSIADGSDILSYLQNTAKERGIVSNIYFNRTVFEASWSTKDALWTVDVKRTDESSESPPSERWHAKYLWMCSGYYKYEAGYTPDFEGISLYSGQVVHPQHWPTDLDCSAKRVVVIGSGATAFTLVPALSRSAKHVTMLQRSPTYVVSLPAINRTANRLKRILPDRLAYWLTRWMNILVSAFSFWAARRWPEKTKSYLINLVRKQLPTGFDVEQHFTPHYSPWDQRICAVPDGDFFQAIANGAVTVVTDQIKTFTKDGILLATGNKLVCDIVVTATGLAVQVFGGAHIVVDGAPVESGKLMGYKGIMYAGIPNMSTTFGYTNASWTLKADLTSEFTCRLINHLDAVGASIVTPRLNAQEAEQTHESEFTPGYFQRAASIMPKQGKNKPWRLNENYLLDTHTLRRGKIDDGVLEFS